MKRYDLRHLHDDFYGRMAELIDEGLKVGEVGIFLFEVGDFSHIQKSADFIRELGHDLMNSLKFNEVDWTIVVKKVDEETRNARAEAVKKAKEEAARKAAEEAAAAEEKAKAEADAAQAKAQAEAKAKEEAEAKAKAEQETKVQASAKKEEKPIKTEQKSAKGDDLTKVKGIGKAYMGILNEMGIYTYADVANMTQEQIDIMENEHSFKGDFKKSVADAKKLSKAKAN